MLAFDAEKNLVMIYQTQIFHQETLIFNLLIPSLESQMNDSKNEFLNEMNALMINWGKQELYNYCFVSTYHLWEKQINHIIRDQSKGRINPPKNKFVFSVKNILKESFHIESIHEKHWYFLDKARIIVNAFKHGEGNSLNDVRKLCPEVLFEEESDEHNSLIEVDESHLRELLNTLIGFYEDLDKETNVDFRNLGNPTISST